MQIAVLYDILKWFIAKNKFFISSFRVLKLELMDFYVTNNPKYHLQTPKKQKILISQMSVKINDEIIH